jgi:acetyltransferase-like isoleucine patch superfamily enzyme
MHLSMNFKDSHKKYNRPNTVVRFIRLLKEINWIKTFIINFKTQTFYKAIKLPIIVYGKLQILDLSGKIILDQTIKTGIIRFGFNTDRFSASKGSAIINITGELTFRGPSIFSVDCCLDVSGVCVIGRCVSFGNSVKVRCWDRIVIGDYSRIVVEAQIFDSNFHYLRNIETGQIERKGKEIIICDFCWVGNRSTIMKGTKIPNRTIVASNSLLNKDYSVNSPNCPVIAGIPAKIISSSLVRVFSYEEEKKIDNYFANNHGLYYSGSKGIIDESDEIERNFIN